MKINNSAHEQIINSLIERLIAKNKYISIETHVQYNENHLSGEVDILAIRDGTHYFFEVKCRYIESTYSTAQKQYAKYCKAHPQQKTRGIFVSPEHICRL